jgi:hypothetical protein
MSACGSLLMVIPTMMVHETVRVWLQHLLSMLMMMPVEIFHQINLRNLHDFAWRQFVEVMLLGNFCCHTV